MPPLSFDRQRGRLVSFLAVFSDRARWMKLAAALAAFAALCWDAERRLPSAYPSVGRNLARLDSFPDRQVLIGPMPVHHAEATGFTLAHPAKRVRIETPHPPAEGQWVAVYGVYRPPDRVVDPRLQVLPEYPLRRAAAFAVSLVVVGLWAALFWRRFRWRRRAFHPEERHG